MPTPSELQKQSQRRSVFGNYAPGSRESAASIEPPIPALLRDAAASQESIDTAVARTFLYSFLARAFEDPEPDSWEWLTSREIRTALHSAAGALAK